MSEEEVNVDAIINEAMSPGATPEIATEGGFSDASAETETPAQDESMSTGSDGRTIKYKGEEVSIDDDRFVDYAQKGYDYQKKMHDYRVEKKLWEAEKAKFQEQFDELKQINEYAKANPQFEQLIQQQWAAIQSGNAPQMDPQTEVQVLSHQLQQLRQDMNSKKEQEVLRQNAELEARQEGAISEFKSKYSDLDWATKDDNGFSLEDRIGQAMIDKKVNDFEIMATYVLKDELMKRQALSAKESAAKGIQKANKLGLGKVTKESTLGVKPTEDIGKKSYDDLIRESFAEMGLKY
jgi:hypothetical protein